MAKADNEARRQNGIFYTPHILAKHLVEPLARDSVPTSVLDPACGNGSLLSAAKEVFFRNSSGNKPDLFGCDLSPDFQNLSQLPAKHVWHGDFLGLQLNQRFDLVLMNPPFVRHHSIPPESKEAYNVGVRGICALPKVADLWAYFLVKSVEAVSTRGTLAAILPWSFLQADYARGLRAWLADRFAAIDVTAISSQQFEDAEERIALIWLRNKGRSAQTITVRNVTHPSEDLPQRHLSWPEWVRSRVIVSNMGSIDDILLSFLDKGFVQFREVAKIRIGTVTGADSFFIAPRRFVVELGLSEGSYHPIVKTLKGLSGFQLNGHCPDHVLMYLPWQAQSAAVQQYIKQGQTEKFHLRAHCIRRNPWYRVISVAPPDAFFPYRTSHTPYLVLNTPGYLCTNSVHAINWLNLDKWQIEWVQVSLLSAPGQLSLEANAKIYGQGVLKIEPNALASALVTPGMKKPLPEGNYEKINCLLETNSRDAASEVATDIIRNCCGIDPQIMEMCKSMLRELRQRRLASEDVAGGTSEH